MDDEMFWFHRQEWFVFFDVLMDRWMEMNRHREVYKYTFQKVLNHRAGRYPLCCTRAYHEEFKGTHVTYTFTHPGRPNTRCV